jgi:hypothetical protein
MSPHHRWLIFEASVLKSRRSALARAAAAGSGIVVFFHRRCAPPRQPALAHQPGNPMERTREPWLGSSGMRF